MRFVFFVLLFVCFPERFQEFPRGPLLLNSTLSLPFVLCPTLSLPRPNLHRAHLPDAFRTQCAELRARDTRAARPQSGKRALRGIVELRWQPSKSW